MVLVQMNQLPLVFLSALVLEEKLWGKLRRFFRGYAGCLSVHPDKCQRAEETQSTDHNQWPGLMLGWLCGTVVERQSLTGEFYLSHARPVADG